MTEQQGGPPQTAGSKWARRLSHLVAFGALALIASSALAVQPARKRSGWYQLKDVLRGENVPNWLFMDRCYEGIPDGEGDLVKLIAPDTGLSHRVPAELLREVDPPLT